MRICNKCSGAVHGVVALYVIIHSPHYSHFILFYTLDHYDYAIIMLQLIDRTCVQLCSNESGLFMSKTPYSNHVNEYINYVLYMCLFMAIHSFDSFLPTFFTYFSLPPLRA